MTEIEIIASSKHILLVTFKNYIDKLKNIKNSITENLWKKKVTIFSDFTANPKYEDILKGVEIVRSVELDLILAIGGGSTLDIAKLISCFLCYEQSEYKDILVGNLSIKRKKYPVFTIPTTFGSGAEATKFAVLYKDKIKYSISSKYIQPDGILLSADFTKNIPKKIAASSVMDVLCQAIESFWSHSANQESSNFSTQALKIIKNFLVLAVNEPSPKNHLKMLESANFAGKAINITRTTAPHAFSYYLTTRYNIPHGEAVGIMMNTILLYHQKYSEQFLTEKTQIIEKILNLKKEQNLTNYIQTIQKEIGLRSKISLSYKEMKILIEQVNTERLLNHPVQIKKEPFFKVLKLYFK